MENNIKFMIIIVLIVGFVLYFEIQRLTKQIDKKKASPSYFYKTFYGKIRDFISLLFEVQDDIPLKVSKEEYEEKLEALLKDVNYAELLTSDKNIELQDGELFNILSKMDALVYESFEEAEKVIAFYKNDLEELYSQRGF